MDWIQRHHVGDLASIIGLAVSVVGFVLTIMVGLRARTAAAAAKSATDAAIAAFARSTTIADVTRALSLMEEIRVLHREGAWHALPDRYSRLRHSLVAIRATNGGLSEDHKIAIQSALQQFTRLESNIEKLIAKQDSNADVPRMNAVVSNHIDLLGEMLISIQLEVKKANNAS